MAIHPTALIDPGAHIGQDVSIGPFCRVASDTHISNGCVLDGSVTICRNTVLGDGCHVHSGAVLGGTPQDVKFDPATVSHTRIGRACVIREGVTIHRGTGDGTETVVGDDCLLMVNSHVGHNARLGQGVTLVNGALLGGHVYVGDGAIISGNCMVHQFCRIGRLSLMSGSAGLSKDLPPFFVMRGGAINKAVGINTVGLRRAGIGTGDRTEIKRAFRMLYLGKHTVTDAVAKIRAELHSDPVAELCDFIEASKRGVCGYDRARPE